MTRGKAQARFCCTLFLVLLGVSFPSLAYADSMSDCLSAAGSPLLDPDAKPITTMTGTRADILALQEVCELARRDAPTSEAAILALTRILYRKGDAMAALAMLDESAGGEAVMITRTAIVAVAEVIAESEHGSAGQALAFDFALRANHAATSRVAWSSPQRLGDYKALLSIIAIHRDLRGIRASDYKEMSDQAKGLDRDLGELALLAKGGSALATELLGYQVALRASSQLLPGWGDIKTVLNQSAENGAGDVGEAWLRCASQFWKVLDEDYSGGYSPSSSITSSDVPATFDAANIERVLVPYYWIIRGLDEEFAKTHPSAVDSAFLEAHVMGLRTLAERGNPYAQAYLAYSAAGTLLGEPGDHFGLATEVPCGFRVALVFGSDSDALQYLGERSDAGDCAALDVLRDVYSSGGRRLKADPSKYHELLRKMITLYSCPRGLTFHSPANGEIFAIESIF